MENKTDFFAHKMFLNQENRNRKQKSVFPTFRDKNTFLFFRYIKNEKKREIELKRRIKKKKTGYKKRETIFQDTEKDPTWKKPMRKGKRENEVFLR